MLISLPFFKAGIGLFVTKGVASSRLYCMSMFFSLCRIEVLPFSACKSAFSVLVAIPSTLMTRAISMDYANPSGSLSMAL